MTMRAVFPFLALLTACGGSSNSAAPPALPPAPLIQLSATAQSIVPNANEIDVSAVLTGLTGPVSWSRSPELGTLYSPGADNTVRFISDMQSPYPAHLTPITITATANGISKSMQLTVRLPTPVTLRGPLPAWWTVTPNSEYSTITGSPVAVLGDGNGSYYLSYSAPVSKIVRRAPDGAISDVASIKNPGSLALGADGTLYVVDTLDANAHSYALRAVGVDGTVRTLTTTAPYVMQEGTVDGPSGIATAASLAITVDRKGNIYAVDNTRVRKIASDGSWSTLAGGKCKWQVDCPLAYQAGADSPDIQSQGGVVVDADGNLYVSEVNKVRKISPAGVVTLLAGAANSAAAVDSRRLDATGASARFRSAGTLTIDREGNLFLVDLFTVRKITPAGVVTTLTGELGGISLYRPEYNLRGISAADKGRLVLMSSVQLSQLTLE